MGRHESTRARDAEIERLGEQVAPPRPEASLRVRPELWEVERARRWREFDYAALDRALELLRELDWVAYGGVMAAFVYGWAPAGNAAAVGLGILDGLLPVPLLVPEVVVDRDELIRRRHREGWRTAEIAGVFGLSVRRVNEILEGEP